MITNKPVIKDADTVLKYAERLAYRDILQLPMGAGRVWYKRVKGNELKFLVSKNDFLDKKEIADIVVKVFNKHGFNARTVTSTESVYVHVEVESLRKEFEKQVEECFIENG